jgi:hypothetical protein
MLFALMLGVEIRIEGTPRHVTGLDDAVRIRGEVAECRESANWPEFPVAGDLH